MHPYIAFGTRLKITPLLICGYFPRIIILLLYVLPAAFFDEVVRKIKNHLQRQLSSTSVIFVITQEKPLTLSVQKSS